MCLETTTDRQTDRGADSLRAGRQPPAPASSAEAEQEALGGLGQQGPRPGLTLAAGGTVPGTCEDSAPSAPAATVGAAAGPGDRVPLPAPTRAGLSTHGEDGFRAARTRLAPAGAAPTRRRVRLRPVPQVQPAEWECEGTRSSVKRRGPARGRRGHSEGSGENAQVLGEIHGQAA